MILMSNDRTSASKKINGMTLIRTLMVSTTAFERMKENSTVFGRLYSATFCDNVREYRNMPAISLQNALDGIAN